MDVYNVFLALTHPHNQTNTWCSRRYFFTELFHNDLSELLLFFNRLVLAEDHLDVTKWPRVGIEIIPKKFTPYITRNLTYPSRSELASTPFGRAESTWRRTPTWRRRGTI
jgi:hypothetical protein